MNKKLIKNKFNLYSAFNWIQCIFGIVFIKLYTVRNFCIKLPLHVMDILYIYIYYIVYYYNIISYYIIIYYYYYIVYYFKFKFKFKNLKSLCGKKTLPTALGFEPGSFNCRSTIQNTFILKNTNFYLNFNTHVYIF